MLTSVFVAIVNKPYWENFNMSTTFMGNIKSNKKINWFYHLFKKISKNIFENNAHRTFIIISLKL